MSAGRARVLEVVLWLVVAMEAVAAFFLRFDDWLLVVGLSLLMGLLSAAQAERFRVGDTWDYFTALLVPPAIGLLVAATGSAHYRVGVDIALGLALPLAIRYSWKLSAYPGTLRLREHRSAEFGLPTRNSIGGIDPPVIGAATNVTIDGIVERESGQTPTPPPFSLNAAVIGMVVMMAVGGFMIWLITSNGW